MREALGKVGYGAVFTVFWPLCLWGLAYRLDAALRLWPVPLPPFAGAVMAALGLALMAWAMRLLWVRGGGLPMNAYPTRHCVTGSLYGVLPHPIYFGFCLAVAGVAVAMGSRAGLWVAAPLAVLACLCLVVGYEAPALARRCGVLPAPLLGLPPATDEAPGALRRLGVAASGLGLWAGLYSLFSLLPAPYGAADWRMAWEHSLPRPAEALWVYSLAYPLGLLLPLLARTSRELRRDLTAVWVTTALGFAAMLLVPGRAALLPVEGDAWAAAWLMDANRALDADWLALPSFHAAWSVLAALALGRRFPAWRLPALILAGAIGASCVLTGSHAVLDVLAGMGLGIAAWGWDNAWAGILRLAQGTANSWRSVRVGPGRIISHALWSGLAGAAGAVILLAWLPPGSRIWGVAILVLGLLGAGLWGTLLEGGGRLSRPYGYYGYLFGTALALAVLAAVAPRLAASSIVGLSVAAPLAQAIGRMRCLVQGCCHGRETNGPGIVVRNPMSRVVSLAGLGGKPIHPTPVGSMLANAALFAILLRVVLLCPSWSLAGGLYLALGSLARFAEEGYRGEPQTRVIAGLPIYQWLAVGCFLAGLAMLAVTAPAVLVPPHLPNGADLAWAAGFGLACAVGMSVDFPDSNMRFSLLTVKAAPGTQEPDSQLPD